MTRTQIGNSAGVTAKQGTSSQNEVQTLTEDGTATSGTFSLAFGDAVTSALTFDDSAADIQTALRALSNISATGVSCSGGALGTNPVVITFAGEYAGQNVPLLEIIDIDLDDSSGLEIAATTAPTQRAFYDADMLTIEAIRARLTAIDGTLYSAANLDKLTYNDMIYALRVNDALETI